MSCQDVYISTGPTRLFLLVAAAFVLVSAGSADRGTAARATVDAAVLADTRGGATAHFLVVLRDQADVAEAVARAPGWRAEGRAAVDALRDAAHDPQAHVRATLDRLGVRYRAYWLVDAIAVEGGRAAVDALARLPEVASIDADRGFRAPTAVEGVETPARVAAVEWNITKIGAPALWAIGVTGQGVVYANADSGVIWDHPALKPHYRGWDGATATHDFNWWDAIHSDISGNGSNSCGFSSTVPCDDDAGGSSHGTHTMGTAVGDDGAGNQVGVAPGAKWIACHNQDENNGRPSTYIECLQFFLAPTDLQGRNANPDRRPAIVGNSYVCPPDELCSEGALKTAIDNMRAAGIFMSVSAGNEGSSCSSITLPPAHYDSSVTVGATDINDVIAGFSSRGPITIDGSGRLKPDLVAPGVNVRSSLRGGYGSLSGTSMASPHVGGAVALLWSAFPNLRGNVDATEQLLEQSARPLTSGQGCGGLSSTAVPNNVYGYGRLDVYAAYQRAEIAFPPALALAGNVEAAEGGDATFTVTLGRPSTRTVTVAYATANGTATAGADYTAATGTLSFAPGERSKQVAVQVTADGVAESNETFTLRLSQPANAALAAATATATITDAAGGGTTVDRTPPKVTRLRVSGRALGFTLSESATATAKVKRGGRVVATVARSLGAGARSLRLPALKPAGYVVTVAARDAAGNTGRASLSFRVRRR